MDNPFHTSIKQTCIPSIYDNPLTLIRFATTTTAPHSTPTRTTVVSHGNNSTATSNAANSAQPVANPDVINSAITSNATNSVVRLASITMPIQIEDTPQIIQNTHSMVTRAKSGISKPKIYSISASEIEPTNFKEVLSNPVWYDVMKSEYNALVLNNTWTLTNPPLGVIIVGCKWVFRNKYNADGSLQHYKARLVAKGFHQQHGFDFNKTFSLVIKPTTVRVILSHAITSRWSIHQIDINNAFLHSDLEENVFMQQPPGFVSSNPTQVCKLNKTIYDLKQAPRSWF